MESILTQLNCRDGTFGMVNNLPNIITLFRLFCIPMVVLFFYLPLDHAHWIAAGLFVLAAFTDWLDGYVARTMNQDSRFGAFLDPVVDKIMVAVVLVLVVSEQGGWLIVLPAAVIIAREIIISALREWMAEIGKRSSVAVNKIGKLKTFAQLLALTMLLIYSPKEGHSQWFFDLGAIFLYVATLLTLWSMVKYLQLAWSDLTSVK